MLGITSMDERQGGPEAYQDRDTPDNMQPVNFPKDSYLYRKPNHESHQCHARKEPVCALSSKDRKKGK